MARRGKWTRRWSGRSWAGDLFSLLKVAGIVVVLAFANYLLQEDRRYEVTGRARVIDGDSLVVDGTEVRLKDVDAPEGRQLCKLGGRDWRCGDEAAKRLRSLINTRTVSCKGRQYDKHDRLLGFCRLGGNDLNGWLVAKGWAVSFGGYRREEQQAKTAKIGIWKSEFQRPQDWRRLNMAR